MQRVNTVREAIAAGRPALGSSVWSGSGTVAEMIGAAGFDFVWLEMEHAPYKSYETVLNLMRAVEATGTSPWVRVPYNDAYLIGQIAEMGVQGIIVPHLHDADDAQRAVEAAWHPPRGTRGVAPLTRIFDYGKPSAGHATVAEAWTARAEETEREIMVIGMIEDADTLEHRLDEIADTDIDGLMYGGHDLSYTLGDPTAHSDSYHPKVLEGRDRVVAACKARGKPALVPLGQLMDGGRSAAEAIAEWYPRGVEIIHVGRDLQMVNEWCRSFFAGLSDT